MAVTGVRANSVVLTQGNYSYDVGGEFTATTLKFSQQLCPITIVNGGLKHFASKRQLKFTPGSSYSYNLSNTDSPRAPTYRRAAFLYYEFSKGILPGYVYNNTAQRKTDAGLFQAASGGFKVIRNIMMGNIPTPSIINNSFYALAINTLGLANATSAKTMASYGVEVLQLWDAKGKDHQKISWCWCPCPMPA